VITIFHRLLLCIALLVLVAPGCGDAVVPSDIDGRPVCENSAAVCSSDETCALVAGQKFKQCYRRCTDDRICDDADFCRRYFTVGLCTPGEREPDFVETCDTPPPAQCLDGDAITWASTGMVLGGRCQYEIETRESCDEGTTCVAAMCVEVEEEE